MTNQELKLKQAGFKITTPRQLILEVLKKYKTPLSAKQIYQYLPQIDLVSIYRNLKLLTNLKIIFQEIINNETFYYLDKKLHHHIVCQKCGRTECLPCNHKYKIKNFTNISHQLILSGLCNHCQ